jgi:2-polyprenyl-3-methyl-5-hydroxy-6-metoxy-1,4-benzoquinol methylase
MRPCPLCRHNKSYMKFEIDSLRVVSCSQCGFVYVANPPATEKEKELYEKYFEQTTLGNYAADSSDTAIRRAWEMNAWRLAWVKKYVSSGRLLDVGCGRGFFMHHARNEGFEVEGVEISVAAAQYASEQLNLTVLINNLDEELSFERQYDVICLWHSLEHFQQPLAVLNHLWTLCSPNGRIFIEVPNFRSLKFQLALPSKKWRGGNHPRYHRSFFTPSTLGMALSSTGFQQIENGYPSYPGPFCRSKLKSCLNRLGLDSFLDVTAVQSPRRE